MRFGDRRVEPWEAAQRQHRKMDRYERAQQRDEREAAREAQPQSEAARVQARQEYVYSVSFQAVPSNSMERERERQQDRGHER